MHLNVTVTRLSLLRRVPSSRKPSQDEGPIVGCEKMLHGYHSSIKLLRCTQVYIYPPDGSNVRMRDFAYRSLPVFTSASGQEMGNLSMVYLPGQTERNSQSIQNMASWLYY